MVKIEPQLGKIMTLNTYILAHRWTFELKVHWKWTQNSSCHQLIILLVSSLSLVSLRHLSFADNKQIRISQCLVSYGMSARRLVHVSVGHIHVAVLTLPCFTAMRKLIAVKELCSSIHGHVDDFLDWWNTQKCIMDITYLSAAFLDLFTSFLQSLYLMCSCHFTVFVSM